jgi:hypothetical protein
MPQVFPRTQLRRERPSAAEAVGTPEWLLEIRAYWATLTAAAEENHTTALPFPAGDVTSPPRPVA